MARKKSQSQEKIVEEQVDETILDVQEEISPVEDIPATPVVEESSKTNPKMNNVTRQMLKRMKYFGKKFN